MTKLIVAFHNFANGHKNYTVFNIITTGPLLYWTVFHFFSFFFFKWSISKKE